LADFMTHEKVFIAFTCHEIPMNVRHPNEKPMNPGDNYSLLLTSR